MSNIGMMHYKVGGTDGVSLEMDKWRVVLEEMGHQVFYCAGDLGSVEGTLIEEMFHHRDDAHRLYHNTFISLSDYPDNDVYRAELYGKAKAIEAKLRAFIETKQIDFLIPENVWSVAVHPSVAIALAIYVLPQPGGPIIKIPFNILPPMRCSSARSLTRRTTSAASCFASSMPITSRQ